MHLFSFSTFMNLVLFGFVVALVQATTPAPRDAVPGITEPVDLSTLELQGSQLMIPIQQRNGNIRMRSAAELEQYFLSDDVMGKLELAQLVVFFAPLIGWLVYGFARFLVQ